MGKKSELDIRVAMEYLCTINGITLPMQTLDMKQALDLMTQAYIVGYDDAMSYVNEKMDEMTRRYKDE